jgi:tRNA(Arg) A34 adenosine deaminase TadA/tryptophan-rich sensory protein
VATATTDAKTSNWEVSAKRYDILALAACLSLTLLLLGGWLTYLGLGPWYYELDFPPFQPPAWVFTPAWTVVLSLLAWATWCVSRQESQTRGVGLALALYGAQCVLNAGWSLLFFTLQRPDVALWALLVLDVTLLLMIVAYARIAKTAGLLLLPYFAWLLFSTAINGWIVQFNTQFGSAATVHFSSVDHDAHMQKAIEVARQNPKAPFGSVLVDRRSGKVVASGVNQSSENPTLHGEMAAINDYVRQGKTDWNQLVLYTTAEPCCMCQGAILWSGIREVVFGTSISQLKSLGWRQIDIAANEVVARSWDPDVQIVGGVRAAECDQLFKAVK